MAQDLIKLNVKKGSSSGKAAQQIIAKFIEACLNLDCSIIEPLIKEDEYFEELDKYRFLASLKEQFDWAVARGANTIRMQRGKCEMCVLGQSVYEFYGDKKTPEFDYVINIKREVIKDIFLCNVSSGRS